MNRVLVTGSNGFVGPYVMRLLGKTASVYGIDRAGDNRTTFPCDILDTSGLAAILARLKPDAIVHLAGFSSVAESFRHPEMAERVNVEGTQALLDAARALPRAPKILIVSSGEVYGTPTTLPITESSPVHPESPYAESRVAQEKLALESGLPICIARSFNHTGPGQRDTFVLSSFAHQIARIEKGLIPPVVHVGNIGIRRDFSDVRDVALAYELLLTTGVPGEVYNVCSGVSHPLANLLNMLIAESGKSIEIRKDPDRVRPSDIPELRGDNSKLLQLGYRPHYSIQQTLQDLLNFWRTND